MAFSNAERARRQPITSVNSQWGVPTKLPPNRSQRGALTAARANGKREEAEPSRAHSFYCGRQQRGVAGSCPQTRAGLAGSPWDPQARVSLDRVPMGSPTSSGPRSWSPETCVGLDRVPMGSSHPGDPGLSPRRVPKRGVPTGSVSSPWMGPIGSPNPGDLRPGPHGVPNTGNPGSVPHVFPIQNGVGRSVSPFRGVPAPHGVPGAHHRGHPHAVSPPI